MAKTGGSGVGNPLGGQRWAVVATSNEFRFVQQKDSVEDGQGIKQYRMQNVYVTISRGDTIQQIVYWDDREERWVTIAGSGSTAEEQRIVQRAHQLWQEQLRKRRKA